MTRIEQGIVVRLATLAALELTSQECDRFERELQDVLDAFDALERAAPKLATPVRAIPADALRDDTIRPGLTVTQVFANAAYREGSHVRGPRTLQ